LQEPESGKLGWQRVRTPEGSMRICLAITATLLLAACGKSDEERLRDAANQSDPAAAAILNNAAEAGVPPQEALQEAGNAAATANAEAATPPSAQARPNLPGQPNPPAPGQPVEKVTPENSVQPQ
jgi:hypothetical protein